MTTYQSEKGIRLTLEIYDGDQLADLTGADVLFRMAPRGGDVVLEKTCVHIALGTVEVVFADGDLDLPAGHYRREWRYIKGAVEETVFEDEAPLRGSLFYDL